MSKNKSLAKPRGQVTGDGDVSIGAEGRYISLREVPAAVEAMTGVCPHRTTPYRWRRDGVRGVRLRTTYAVGTHRTTEAWLSEFFFAIAATSDSAAVTP